MFDVLHRNERALAMLALAGIAVVSVLEGNETIASLSTGALAGVISAPHLDR